MKKKSILIAATTAVIAAAGIYWGYNTNQNEGLSVIQLANIEALADGEGTLIGDKIPCHSKSKRNNNRAYVDCASCTRIENWEGQGTEATCTR